MTASTSAQGVTAAWGLRTALPGTAFARRIFASFLTLWPFGFPAVRPCTVFQSLEAGAEVFEDRRVRRFVDALQLVGVGVEVVQFLLARPFVLEVGVP